MTRDKPPSWPELIAECAESVDPSNKLRKQLFDFRIGTVTPKFNILICAQILEQRFKQERKSLKEEIVSIINKRVSKDSIDTKRLKEAKQFFRKYSNINIVTTNYDKLFSDFILPKSRVITEGNMIPKINSGRSMTITIS